VTLDGEVAHVARTAVDLERVVGHPVGHLRTAGFRQRRVEGGEPVEALELGAQRPELGGRVGGGVGGRRAGRRSHAGPGVRGCRLRRRELRHATLEAFLRVDDQRRLVEQGTGGLDAHPHVGQHGRHRGEPYDGGAELHPFAGILHGLAAGGFGDALSLRGDSQAGAVHKAHDVGREAAPALADEQRRGVVELQLAGR